MLADPSINYSSLDFVNAIALLKGNIKERLEQESKNARIGPEYELRETPMIITPRMCITYSVYEYLYLFQGKLLFSILFQFKTLILT